MSAINQLRSFSYFVKLNFLCKPKFLFRLIANPDTFCKHQSYYPELPAKSKGKIWREQFSQTLRHGWPNDFYFSYGFDVKGNDEIKEYYHYQPFARLRDRYNSSGDHNSTAILRNKFLFGMFCSYLGVDSGDNIGVINNAGVYMPHLKQTITLSDFLKETRGNFFVKLIDGECGCGIFTMTIADDGAITVNGEQALIDNIESLTRGGTYLVQRTVEQHPEMARLHPQSLNTMRLVTIKNIHSGKISVFPSILRIGTGNSFVDNTSQGGVAVGIDFETGRLKQHGFLKPQFGSRVDTHPDSGIRFSEFTIPHLKEAMDQAAFLHSMLPDIHSIGWDIAIGPNGPIFIEGNDNWEINGPQICNGPLKSKFKSMLIG